MRHVGGLLPWLSSAAMLCAASSRDMLSKVMWQLRRSSCCACSNACGPACRAASWINSLRTLLQNKSLGAALSGPVEYPDALAAQGTAVAIIAWLRLRLTSLLEPPIVFPALPPRATARLARPG